MIDSSSNAYMANVDCLSLTGGSVATSDSIVVDLGPGTGLSTGTINNLTDTGGLVANAVAKSGAATGVQLKITNAFAGAFANPSTASNLYPASA